MNDFMGPVPMPALDAVAPEVYRGFYGMPMFTLLPTRDLEASKDFWIRGLGFIDLFSAPGQVTHLRRWAFQDVLLLPVEQVAEQPSMSISFSCVPSQIDEIRARCEELVPGSAAEPEIKPWNSLELTVHTPENTRVVMTAARPIDPDSAVAANLRAMGIEVPAGG
ncbi:VOC family protein [Streptomyces sp. SID13031]|uniref:VOC family protein n=1 Tax=Streptomyces sp. SID13031 TaxID=2706046 RepID=UPI0013CB0D64|nr:VOC family protein [Streptomyces sp. SID13031]NEA33965.1 VOC family protein [Streptomyces sp. SID13031]